MFEREEIQVDLYCNYPRNGLFAGQLWALKVGPNMEFGSKFIDWGPRLRFLDGRIAIAGKVKAVWPDQGGNGTHMNITGIGVLEHAPHREAAVRFIEYLTSEQAQRFLEEGNNEWPAVESVKIDNPALEALGDFKPDPLPIGRIGKAQLEAAKIVDRVGWR